MKRNYWPLFFIGIFSFVFAMIIWTIKSASSVPIHPDKSFLESYQEVDKNYNKMMESNYNFLAKYDFEFYVNNKKVDLSTDDIKYSQRVLEKISQHKDLLKVGKNQFNLSIVDKKTSKKQVVDIMLNVTKSSSNDSDIIFNSNSFENNNDIYSSSFEIKESNNWNITGRFKINDEIGYIYIKTNAI